MIQMLLLITLSIVIKVNINGFLKNKSLIFTLIYIQNLLYKSL